MLAVGNGVTIEIYDAQFRSFLRCVFRIWADQFPEKGIYTVDLNSELGFDAIKFYLAREPCEVKLSSTVP